MSSVEEYHRVVTFSCAFSSLVESIHGHSTKKPRPFVGSRVPAILSRMKITAREGPSQCLAQIIN